MIWAVLDFSKNTKLVLVSNKIWEILSLTKFFNFLKFQESMVTVYGGDTWSLRHFFYLRFQESNWVWGGDEPSPSYSLSYCASFRPGLLW